MIPQILVNLFFIFCIIDHNHINYIRATVILQQHFRRTPDNQTATISDTVTLACSIINKQGVLQWTRDGFGLGADRNLNGYERYRMVGSEEEGDYTLVIDHVTLEDDAIFQCQVGPGANGAKELRSANAKLTVEIPTGKPEIMQGEFLQATEDEEIQLECISRGGKPAAEITWLDGNGQEIKSGVNVIKELLEEDGKRYNTRSILTLTPKKEMNNKTFTCQAHNHPSKEVTSDFIKLNVKYSPKVTLKILSQSIREYDNVRISCKADGNPEEMSYRWFLNNKEIKGDYTSFLIINDISRAHDKHEVKCEVSNSIGKAEASQTLNVNYGPTFLHEFQNVHAESGTSVPLSCLVGGNPRPEIVWYHEESKIVVSTQPNFTVVVSPETVGKYICQAVVQGFAEISAESYIHLKGPPKIQSSKIQFGREDDLIKLECFAMSIPKANSITWSHGGAEISTDDVHYAIKEDTMSNGVKSTLIIKTSKDADFGPYNCTVANQYGTRVMEIFLMKQKNPQLVILLTAVIASVVIVVAFTMVTILCQRTGPKKADLMRSNIQVPEKNNIHLNINNKSDASSNNSDLKVEIRTASSLSNLNEDSDQPWNEDHSDILNIKNDSLYRYSDYLDPIIYPSNKKEGHNNNGYIPYGNYTARDYNSPKFQLTNGIVTGAKQIQNNISTENPYLPMNPPPCIDPRNYAIPYGNGNPYLRISSNSNNSNSSGSGNNVPIIPPRNQQPPPQATNHHRKPPSPPYVAVSKPPRLNNTAPLSQNFALTHSAHAHSRSNSNPPAPQVPRSTPTPVSVAPANANYVPSKMTHYQLKPTTLATHV